MFILYGMGEDTIKIRKEGTRTHLNEREKYQMDKDHILELPLISSFIRACKNDIRVVNLTVSTGAIVTYLYRRILKVA